MAAVRRRGRSGGHRGVEQLRRSEFSGETTTAYNGHFNHPGVAITVSSGDGGYGVEFPAASQYVTAVGGTSLTYNRTSGTRVETAWSGAGSGCSAYVSKPTWQVRVPNCSKRMVADVSAVADPFTGVSVYDSYGSTGGANWFVFGGTSVAAPIIASVYALAGDSLGTPQYPYQHATSLFDVTNGSDGRCTSGRNGAANAPLCTAGTGWDGPTGLGTPNGIGASDTGDPRVTADREGVGGEIPEHLTTDPFGRDGRQARLTSGAIGIRGRGRPLESAPTVTG